MLSKSKNQFKNDLTEFLINKQYNYLTKIDELYCRDNQKNKDNYVMCEECDPQQNECKNEKNFLFLKTIKKYFQKINENKIRKNETLIEKSLYCFFVQMKNIINISKIIKDHEYIKYLEIHR